MISASTRGRRDTALGQKLLMLAGGLFCFALILIPLLWRPQPQVEESPQPSSTRTVGASKKSQQAWNIALGNVVMVAPELGLGVKAPKDLKIESSRLASMIESQLNSLRELYRAETEKHTRMIGGLVLEFTVGEAGRVKHAQEIASRINDAEFRKAVVVEAQKWNFDGLLPDGATIRCPLLFIREGMEINTVMDWEKQLGFFEEKSSAAAASRAAASTVSAAPARDGLAPESDKAIETPRDQNPGASPARDVVRGKKAAGKSSAKNRRPDTSDMEQETRSSIPSERSEM